MCVRDQCPGGTFLAVETSARCEKCDPTCNTCSGLKANLCTSCFADFRTQVDMFWQGDGTCAETCSSEKEADWETHVCKKRAAFTSLFIIAMQVQSLFVLVSVTALIYECCYVKEQDRVPSSSMLGLLVSILGQFLFINGLLLSLILWSSIYAG